MSQISTMHPMNATTLHEPGASSQENARILPLVVSIDDYIRLQAYALTNELADELDRAIVVHMEHMPSDVVAMNTRCTYLDTYSGMHREVELVFPEHADPSSGKISVLSPVGSALIGLRIGQEIDWIFPNDSTRRLKVTAISKSTTSTPPRHSQTKGHAHKAEFAAIARQPFPFDGDLDETRS